MIFKPGLPSNLCGGATADRTLDPPFPAAVSEHLLNEVSRAAHSCVLRSNVEPTAVAGPLTN